MTDLMRAAAQQALEAMLNFPDDISDEMFESITALKAALVEDALQKFSDVNQELEAALAEHDKNLAGFKERKANWDIRAPRSPRDLQCKLAEETQERDRQRREYEEQRLAALAEPVQDVKGCDVCEHPLYAGIKCRVCGRVTQAEPVQEPVQDGKCKHCVDGCPACDARKLPVQEPVAWTYEWKHRLHGGSLNVSRARWPESHLWIETPLYAAPPQRKPLTREEAIALWADKSDGPSNSEIVSFARAIERAHGIGGSDD